MTLVYLAGAWLLGTVASAASGELWWPGVAALATAGLAAAALERRPQLALIGLACAGLFIAAGVRYDGERPSDEPAGIALQNDTGIVRFRALVADEPDVRGTTQRVRLDMREVLDGNAWRETSGGVLLRSGLFPRYAYGDVIEVSGEIETPPALPDFDYREYLAQRGIASVIDYPSVRRVTSGEGNDVRAALYSARRTLGDAIERALPEPQAALAGGMLLGERSAIPQDLTDDMNAAGTSHLIAISGQNITLVAALVISGLAWLIGRRQAALVALAVIGGYTLLTGASPPVVRAAIMGGLFVTATLLGRPASALPSIALAAAVMTGVDPTVVQDPSFQLSFAAIVGLVYLTPALQASGAELLGRAGIESAEGGVAFLLESSAMTLGATAATLPLIALHFGRVSLVSPVANLLAVPAFPLIIAATALTAAAGLVWQPLGDATGWFAWAMLSYLIEVARFLAGLPLASLHIDGFGRWHAAGSYVALAAGGWWLTQRRPQAPATPPVAQGASTLRPAYLLAGGLALLAAFAWWQALDSERGRLTVSVLDVGEGDAVLIETPDGHTVLVDGGPDGRKLLRALGEELPFWDRTLDLVALSHTDADHLAGLIDALERYDVRQVLATPLEADTALYREWRARVGRAGVPYHEAQAGASIALGGGATLRVLSAGEAAAGVDNDASLVLKLSYGDVDFLLTGDIEATGERALLASDVDLRSEVLKVAHHGSLTSSSPAFVRAVGASVAVVSAGENNRYGHPSPTVLSRLDGSLVLRTDQRGTIRLVTDGRRLWVDR